ncbi:restriction endonuclease subunit S [Thermococcus sp.]|uniref:restriction endonuclease subunit S n=2 Tax=Thermococcus sp. TaxID=35749 RepID=UPI0026342F41|nr:restriction endonuclease subunit S [Thermococcus sp.]
MGMDVHIEDLPEGWSLVKLKEVAKIRGNKRVREINKVALIPMELIPDSGIFADYRVVPVEKVKSSTYCEAGDILLAKITPSLENGKQGIVPFDIPNGFALATTEVFPIAPEEDKIDRFFLFYLLKFNKFRQKIIASMTGTTGRQRASKKAVENLLIPLPPLPEQRKIAEILRTVDEAIEKTDEAIERTERLKKGLMQRLLTRGIKHERFKKTELGEIPEEWQVVRLEEVAERRNETVKPDSIEEVPFVGLEHIEPGRIKLSQWGSSRNVKSLKSKFHCGDILYGKLRPYLDKAVIAEFNGICSTDIIVIRTKSSKTIPEYLIWIIHSKRFIEYAKKTMKGVNHPRTSWNSIKQFQLPLPPLEEQKQIAEILSTVDKKLELLRQRREKLERVKRGLMKDLLTGRRRVKHYGDQKI